MSVVGLDFGGKNTLIAAAGRGGVDVILNGNSNRLNPTMVGFGESRKIGEDATSGESSNYKNTIQNIKRLIGLSFLDPRAQREISLVPFTCVPVKHQSGGPDSIGVQVSFNGQDTVVPIEAVAGMMVKHMGIIAAEKAALTSSQGTGANSKQALVDSLFPKDWVISIPSYFTDAQRRALLAGCEIVGVTGIRRLMHENTATALAYGIFKDLRKEFTKDKPTNVMFIDVGASAYTVSITAFEPGKLIVKSTFFDQDLGGRDFDELIANWVATKFEEKFKGKLSAKPMSKPKVRLKLLKAAEKAKKTLSPHGVKEARVNLECLMDDLDFSCVLKADEYEKMCEPLLARLAAPVKKAMEEAKLTKDDLTSVEIVGGTSRIACVKRELSKVIGISLSTTMNADEAVARGTALQSAILSPRFKVLPYEIQEAQPFPIKISWDEQVTQEGMEGDGQADEADPTNSVLMFGRNLNFPIVRRVTLRRAGDFCVTSTYDESGANYGMETTSPKEIAQFEIKVQPGDLQKVRVNVKQDIHGIISLSSAQMVEEIEEEESIEVEMKNTEGDQKEAKVEEKKEKKKKIKKTNLEFTTSRTLDWTQAEINNYNEKEVAMVNIDRVVKETSDMRNELESYIYDMRDKVSMDSQLGKYGTDVEKSAFTSKLEAMENWLYEEGFDATKSVYFDKLSELKKLGGPLQMRQVESQGRPNAMKSLQMNIDQFKNWALQEAQSNPIYSHINDEERQKVLTKCDEASSWMYGMLDKQGSLPVNVDPVVSVSQIQANNSEVTNVCSPIRYKKAPPPPKNEGPKEKDGENGAAASKGNGDGSTEKPTGGDGSTEKPTEGDGATPMEGVETEKNSTAGQDAPKEMETK